MNNPKIFRRLEAIKFQIQKSKAMNDKHRYHYTHFPLNSEVTAIGGHYVVSSELKLKEDGREIFCTIGYGIMDTTCCGTGGCAYATVYGYILNWQGETNADGYKITRFQPIRNPDLKKVLHDRLMAQEIIQQVVFI